MNSFTQEERNRLFNLQCRSRRGEFLRPEDIIFLEDCFKLNEVEYDNIADEVFAATAPFGAKL